MPRSAQTDPRAMTLYGVALASSTQTRFPPHAFVVGLSRPDGSDGRRFENRTEVLERLFERRIQQVETEIDFGLGRR